MCIQHDLCARVIASALFALLASCGSEPTPAALPAPAPAPAVPVEPAAELVVEKVEPVAPPTAPEPEATATPEASKPIAKPEAAKPEAPKPVVKASAVELVAKRDVPKPIAEPVASEPTPKPEAKTQVRVPQSAHVRTVVPKALQALLDADTRMQPWVDRTLSTIESCYEAERAKNEQAAGTVVVAITMHENGRPDADVKALPPQLSGVLACATGKLMRAPRMPLFTGPEGATHTVQITFAR